MQPYTEDFYRTQQGGARQSAKVIVPLVLEVVQPRHIIDIGCGIGTWLSVFREYGVEDIWGVDGEYINKAMLEIPEERFLPFDLKQPFHMGRQFDLVVSLEVAEHLPGECAETFVDSLTRLGPVVLFSAAIPFQGGRNHLNEQWPEYWANLFQEKNYVAIDCLRRKIWQNENVEWWYSQNILVFVARAHLDRWPLLKREYEAVGTSQLSLVHPKKYLDVLRLHMMIKDIAAVIPPGDTFIFVDQEQLRGELPIGHGVIPFLEREGHYWGPPPDDSTAICELERLRQSGAGFIIFAWPAFWWLDYYAGLHQHLRSEFRCVLYNDRLIAFDLRS